MVRLFLSALLQPHLESKILKIQKILKIKKKEELMSNNTHFYNFLYKMSCINYKWYFFIFVGQVISPTHEYTTVDTLKRTKTYNFFYSEMKIWCILVAFCLFFKILIKTKNINIYHRGQIGQVESNSFLENLFISWLLLLNQCLQFMSLHCSKFELSFFILDFF